MYAVYVECMSYTVKAEGIRKSFGGKGKGAKAVLDGVDLAVELSR